MQTVLDAAFCQIQTTQYPFNRLYCDSTDVYKDYNIYIGYFPLKKLLFFLKDFLILTYSNYRMGALYI